MPRNSSVRPKQTGEIRRARIKLLSALVAICRSLERLQASSAARTACRQVRTQITGLLARDQRGSERL